MNLTNEQTQKLVSLLDKHILVNANWALAAMPFVFNLSQEDSYNDAINPTPFTYDDAEKFFNYKPADGSMEDDDTIEFPQCLIVSNYLGQRLQELGELVINTINYGMFWFAQEYGTFFEDRELIQKAFADLL